MQFLTNQSKTNPNAIPIFVGLASETQKLKPKRKGNDHEEIIINSQRSIGHSDLI